MVSMSKMLYAMRVLYLHGLGQSAKNRVAKQIDSALKGTGVAFDSFSYPSSECWRINQWLSSLQDHLQAQPDNDTILVGQSGGGYVALSTALKLPQKVAGLFLLSPGIGMDYNYINKVVPRALDRLRAGEQVVHPASKSGDETLIDFESLRTYREGCPSRMDGTLTIDCPIYAVHAQKDPLALYKDAEAFLGRLRGGGERRMTAVPGGSHLLTLDDGAIREEFSAFCARVGIDIGRSAEDEEQIKRSTHAKI